MLLNAGADKEAKAEVRIVPLLLWLFCGDLFLSSKSKIIMHFYHHEKSETIHFSLVE